MARSARRRLSDSRSGTASSVPGGAIPPRLQLTPLDPTGPEEAARRAVIAAGAWCAPAAGTTVLPFAWHAAGSMQEAFETAVSAHARLLPALAQALDAVHGTRHDERYWHVVLGPFLIWYLETLLDRRQVLATAANMRPAPVVAPSMVDAKLHPADTRDFMRLASESDAWNAALFWRVNEALDLLATTGAPGEPVQRPAAPPEHEPLTLLSRLAVTLKRAAAPAAGRARTVLHLSYGLGRSGALKLAFVTGGSLQRFEPTVDLPGGERPRDARLRREFGERLVEAARQREQRAPGTARVRDPLVELALRLLPDDLPASALERYGETLALARRLPYGRVESVVSDAGWYFDEVFKVWAAERYLEGAALVGLQHGGGYGSRAVDTGEWFERAVTDRFISWGWGGENVLPLPSPRLARGLQAARRRPAAGGALLWASNAVPRYVHSLDGWPQAAQYLAYLAWQERFLAASGGELRARLLLRPYTRDYGWSAPDLARAHPELRLDRSGHARFLETLASASCFLCDNLNTTYLQALALDVPTVLFWDPELFPANAEHRAWEERLARVGVLHRTPESAAAHLTRHLDDLEGWWGDPAVRTTVDAYRRRYAWTRRDWIAAWHTGLGRGRGPGADTGSTP